MHILKKYMYFLTQDSHWDAYRVRTKICLKQFTALDSAGMQAD